MAKFPMPPAGMSWPWFRPTSGRSFLNRLDEIILFRRLAREHMGGIVDIQLRHLAALLAARKLELSSGRRGPRLAGQGWL